MRERSPSPPSFVLLGRPLNPRWSTHGTWKEERMKVGALGCSQDGTGPPPPALSCLGLINQSHPDPSGCHRSLSPLVYSPKHSALPKTPTPGRTQPLLGRGPEKTGNHVKCSWFLSSRLTHGECSVSPAIWGSPWELNSHVSSLIPCRENRMGRRARVQGVDGVPRIHQIPWRGLRYLPCVLACGPLERDTRK